MKNVEHLLYSYIERVKKVQILQAQLNAVMNVLTVVERTSIEYDRANLVSDKKELESLITAEEVASLSVDKVLGILQKTYPTEYEWLMLRYFYGRSYNAISKEYDCHPTTIRKRLAKLLLEFSILYN